MSAKVIATIVVLAIATLSLMRYHTLNNEYDQSRPALPSDTSFALVYKLLVAAVLLVALASYWTNAATLVKFYDSDALRLTGTLVSVIGAGGFEASVRALGEHYSPCYDLRAPKLRVLVGPYRWFSHPMYASNCAILLGVFVSSGSLWAALVTAIVGVYYFRSARTEDRSLSTDS